MAEYARKKRQEAVGNLKVPTDLGGGGEGDRDGGAPGPQQQQPPGAGPPPVPTKPLWPGKSTAQSVDKYAALSPASPFLLCLFLPCAHPACFLRGRSLPPSHLPDMCSACW